MTVATSIRDELFLRHKSILRKILPASKAVPNCSDETGTSSGMPPMRGD